MCSHSKYSRLCHLIDDYLRPYTELEGVSITKEKEKDVLVALSQVLKQIQLWTYELDSNSETGTLVKPACISEFSDDDSKPYSEDHHCFYKILGDVIALLAVESQFVQHLAGNVLVVICEFVAASGSELGELIQLLCVYLEWAISNILSDSSTPSTTGAELLDSNSSSCIIVLKSRLKNANWSTLAGIVQVLRNILKHLKQEDDDKLLETYLNSISSCLSHASWDLLKILVDLNGEACRVSTADALHLSNVGLQKSVIVFLGNLVQFFCSLVEQSGLMEAAGGSRDKNLVFCKISNLVPKLLQWCLGKQVDWNNSCISQYFRHKMLMIMIRLSFKVPLEHSVLALWLQLLHEYFQDLLWQPLMRPDSGQDDCLEGSPFLSSFLDEEVHSMFSYHLQRQAIFLFLKCSLGLINMREGINEQCACASPNFCLTSGIHSSPDCCSRKKGLLELYQWLRVHLPVNLFADYEIYMETCINFALSFLQLYMHEDDILFEVLLQLLSVPSCAEQQVCKERKTFKEVKDDALFLVSNLFNPIHLFHLFLAELHYDHLVLLDYLISKDAGISCAEYFLRCLRAVCDSWHLFVEFPLGVEVLDQSPCKKMKVFPAGLTLQVGPSSAQVKGDGTPLSLERKCERDYTYSSKHCRARERPFKEAKECLLMLKNSVENLHHKNLFPYNPEVLLRRLTRFQELCLKQEKYYLARTGGSI